MPNVISDITVFPDIRTSTEQPDQDRPGRLLE